MIYLSKIKLVFLQVEITVAMAVGGEGLEVELQVLEEEENPSKLQMIKKSLLLQKVQGRSHLTHRWPMHNLIS
jgi:hypothetical protein